MLRVVFKLAFAACFVLTVSLAADDAPKGEKSGEKKITSIAHIRLSGDIDETPVANDPLFGAMGENFKTKLERIQKAQKDPNVKALYLHVDGLQIGWAKMDELRKTLADFRKSGKKVYAYVEDGAAKDYLVAIEADKVCMPPSGFLIVVGMRAEMLYFKNLLEKLGIRADFITMGDFKSAGEMFTNEKASPEAKSQLKTVLEDFFLHNYIGSIQSSRKKAKDLSTDDVRKLIDDGMFSAQQAKKAGLIDNIAYVKEFEKQILKDLGGDELKIQKDYGKQKAADLDFSNPFALLKLLAPTKTSLTGKSDRIALIYAVGSIHTGKSSSSIFGGTTIGSTTMIEAIRQADADPKVRAIVLRVDSGGGSALASDLIWNELKNCKKPVVASMSDVAASGGYYICMSAKKIFADPGTLTGSIGVISGKLATKGLYDKIGITTDTIAFGKNSGLLNSSDVFAPSEKVAMKKLMVEVYDQFLTKAIEGRKNAGKIFNMEQLRKLADGRIWTGRQAKEKGLIDELGGFDDAIAEAKVQGGLDRDADVDYLILPKPRSFIDALLDGEGFGVSAMMSPDMRKLALTPELRRHFQQLEGMWQMRNDRVWMMLPFAVEMK